jgi:hypothetical protein
MDPRAVLALGHEHADVEAGLHIDSRARNTRTGPNGKLREELLDCEIFEWLFEAKVSAENFRIDYNRFQPHSSLGYLAPSSSPSRRPSTNPDPRRWSSGPASRSPRSGCSPTQARRERYFLLTSTSGTGARISPRSLRPQCFRKATRFSIPVEPAPIDLVQLANELVDTSNRSRRTIRDASNCVYKLLTSVGSLSTEIRGKLANVRVMLGVEGGT